MARHLLLIIPLLASLAPPGPSLARQAGPPADDRQALAFFESRVRPILLQVPVEQPDDDM